MLTVLTHHSTGHSANKQKIFPHRWVAVRFCTLKTQVTVSLAMPVTNCFLTASVSKLLLTLPIVLPIHQQETAAYVIRQMAIFSTMTHWHAWWVLSKCQTLPTMLQPRALLAAFSECWIKLKLPYLSSPITASSALLGSSSKQHRTLILLHTMFSTVSRSTKMPSNYKIRECWTIHTSHWI